MKASQTRRVGGGGREYWHELLTQGFLGLFGSSSVFSHDWSMVSKGNYKYSHSLLLSTQTIIKKDCNQSPFSFVVRGVRAFSHVCGHFPLLCVLLDRPTKKRYTYLSKKPNIFILRSTLSKTDTFGTGTNCPS